MADETADEAPAKTTIVMEPDPKDPYPHRWKKGQSGNPKGRPKGRKLMAPQREATRLVKDATPEAVARLTKMLRSADDRIAIAAAKIILERGLPPPKADNPWALPDDIKNRTPEEQLIWMKDQAQALGKIVRSMESQLSKNSVLVLGE